MISHHSFLMSDGCPIACRTVGSDDRPALVLLHSLGLDGEMWRLQLERWAPTLRLVLVDVRGHGRSGTPPGPYTIERMATDVLEVCAQLQIERFHLCGVSLGGLIALWLAIHHPPKVHRLVCSNTAPKITHARFWDARIDSVRRYGVAGIARSVSKRFFAPTFLDREPAIVEHTTATLRSASDVGYIGACEALRDTDLRAEVARIALPTLVIVGNDDIATPASDAEWLHHRIAGSRLQILPAVGHLANLEAPNEFGRLVIEHLG